MSEGAKSPAEGVHIRFAADAAAVASASYRRSINDEWTIVIEHVTHEQLPLLMVRVRRCASTA